MLLQEQNKRLAERLRALHKAHEELNSRNEALTLQHQEDERVLFILFRFWNQVCNSRIYIFVFFNLKNTTFE